MKSGDVENQKKIEAENGILREAKIQKEAVIAKMER